MCYTFLKVSKIYTDKNVSNLLYDTKNNFNINSFYKITNFFIKKYWQNKATKLRENTEKIRLIF